MIYIKDINDFTQSFEELLSQTGEAIERDFTIVYNSKNVSGTVFEAVVCDKLNLLSKGTVFEGKFEQTSSLSFPDIIAKILENNWFGIEVKTSKDSWKCFGNSIFETTKIDNLDNRIYLFFGKIATNVLCRWSKYEHCIETINITHSPRYQINMEILDSEKPSVFLKMRTSYEAFSEMQTAEKMKLVRSFKRQELGRNAALWWLPTSDDPNDSESNLVIRLFSELTVPEKKRIRNLSITYFPIVFSNQPKKYEELIKWSAANFGVISSSMRDTFSAGGKHKIYVQGKLFKIPRIYGHVEDNLQQVKEILLSTPLQELNDFWDKKMVKKDDVLLNWIKTITSYSETNQKEITAWLIELFSNTNEVDK